MNSAEYIDCSQARLSDLDHKWKVLFNQKTRAPIYNVDQYVETLKEYINEKSGNKIIYTENGSKQSSDIHPLSYFLRKLKLDLKMSYRSFLDEFTQPPNDGVEKLVKLLKVIQKASRDLSSGQGRMRIQNAKRLLNDEHDCLLCIRFCLRIQRAVQNLLDESYGLESIATVLMSSNTKSRLTAIEIMILVLTEKEGFTRNLECFTYFRVKNCEPFRFKFLIGMLMSNSHHNTRFQICCMKYINSLLAAAPDSNTQVFLQNELECAGLDIEALINGLEERSDTEVEELGRELLLYRKTRIDIDLVLQSNTSLENYTSNLQLKIIELKDEIKKLQSHEKSTALPISMHKTGVGGEAGNTRNDNKGTVSNNGNNDTSMQKVPKVGPVKKLQRSRCKLPLLNWKPISDITDTIFEGLDYFSVIEKLDRSAFEDIFGSPQTEQEKPTAVFKTPRRSTVDDKVSFLDPARAKSLLILQKRIGQTPPVIKQMIQTFAMDMLNVDDAELLLKFIPSEQEMKNLSSLNCTYEELGEAEQLLTQLMSVERIEEKLKLIIFMSQFYDKIVKIKPQLDAIRRNSACLNNNVKMRKVLEIILALGNILNSEKEMSVTGFRIECLQQLQEIRSTDKSLNLMDYLVQVITDYYPGIKDWYKEINMESTPKGSFQALLKENEELQEGIQLLEEERTCCPCQQLDIFKSSTESDVNQITATFQEMELSYELVCKMFGENHLLIEPDEFFGQFQKFIELYRRAESRIVNSKPSLSLDASKNHKDNDKPSMSLDVLQDLKHHLQSRQKHHTDEVNEHRDEFRYKDMYIESPSYGDKNISFDHEDNYACDPYGIMIDHKQTTPSNRSSGENWIIGKQIDDLQDKNDIHTRTVESGVFCGSDVDSDNGSCDSAFVSSLEKHRPTNLNLENEDYTYCKNITRRTSTPQTEEVLPVEPEPDYPTCNTPSGSIRSYSSEVSRILREFEGSLNGYEGEVEVVQNSRKFYTIKSIIYL